MSVHDDVIKSYEEDIQELIKEDGELEKELDNTIRRRKVIQLEIINDREFINKLKEMNKILEDKFNVK